MNTAHQREDHHSVTKALLLMFHIFRGKHSDELLSASSSEDILTRCLKRCVNFRMYSQISEIALLLAQCRSRGPTNPSYRRIKKLQSTRNNNFVFYMSFLILDPARLDDQLTCREERTGTYQYVVDGGYFQPHLCGIVGKCQHYKSDSFQRRYL